jgi:hypothetical protein
MKKIVCFTVACIFLLTAVCVAQPEPNIIGDFEKEITTQALLDQHEAFDREDPNTRIDLMDLWDTWWRYKADVAAQVEVSSSTTIGVTLNNQSLRLEFPVQAQANNAVEPLILDIIQLTQPDFNDVNKAFFAHTSISMDVTIDPADWIPLNPDLPVSFGINFVVNSENGRWHSEEPDSDTINPDDPGRWNSTDFTTIETRHLSWGLSAHQARNKQDDNSYFECLIQLVTLNNTSGPGVLYLDNIQFHTPVTAAIPSPGFNEQDVQLLPTLSWTPGALATSHTIYFGMDANEVNEATVDAHPNVTLYDDLDETTYAITERLAFNTTYYWRVDETDGSQIWPGEVWKFNTGSFQLIDDFESYPTTKVCGSRIFETWRDGQGFVSCDGIPGYSGNGTTMSVGVKEKPYGPETNSEEVYNGDQSLPLRYNNTKKPYIAEAERTFEPPQDFTTAFDSQALATLDMQIHGRYLSLNGFTDDGNDQYTVVGSGRDIIATEDQFHFAFQPQPLGSSASITAKIVSVENVHHSAKGGVMIRDMSSSDSFEPDAVYAAVISLPDGDIVFQHRDVKGGTTTISRPADHTFTLPYWVRLTKNGTSLIPEMSADGVKWDPVAEPNYISMINYTVGGLAVTSHEDAGTPCTAVFSNVSLEGTTSSIDTSMDIGLPKNEPENMYVRLEDNNGEKATAHYDDDPNGPIHVLDEDGMAWEEWKLFSTPLSDFTDANSVIDLTQIKKIVIGVGTAGQRASLEGQVWVDDVRLTLPIPDPNETE